jgi:hypothetical protein
MTQEMETPNCKVTWPKKNLSHGTGTDNFLSSMESGACTGCVRTVSDTSTHGEMYVVSSTYSRSFPLSKVKAYCCIKQNQQIFTLVENMTIGSALEVKPCSLQCWCPLRAHMKGTIGLCVTVLVFVTASLCVWAPSGSQSLVRCSEAVTRSCRWLLPMQGN